MFNLIIRTLKRVGIKLVLKEFHLDSYLNFYRLDFIDKYDNWCRLNVFYNDTHFFLNDVKLLGEGREEIYTDKIINNIEMMGKYEDFVSYEYKVPNKEELDEFLASCIASLSDDLYSISAPNFKIKEVKVFASPTLMVFIYFTYKGKRFEPIRIFIGEEISYKNNLDGIDLLLEQIKEVLRYDELLGPNRHRED